MTPIYLESDEEITSVVDKITNSPSKQIALVAAKNSNFFQSLVNLKLIQKESQKLGKKVALITNNKIGHKLAEQVGLDVYSNLGSVSSKPVLGDEKPSSPFGKKEILPEGITVKQYAPVTGGEVAEGDAIAEEAIEEAVEEAALATEAEDKPIVIGAADDVPALEQKSDIAEKDDKEPVEKAEHHDNKDDKEEDMPAIVSHGMPVHNVQPIKIPWKLVALAGALAILAGVVCAIFLPKATVTITYQSTPISETMALSAQVNPSGDTAIAGNLITSETDASKKFAATGKKDIGTKAGGTMTVTNETGVSQAFALGTSFKSSGLSFNANKAFTVPAATASIDNNGDIKKTNGTVQVDVTAAEPGEKYNIAAGDYTLTGYTKIYGKAGAMSGGLTKQITVLSQEDIDKATTDLLAENKTKATEDITAKAQNQKIFTEALTETITNKKITDAVGAQVAESTVSLHYALSTIAFDQTVAVNKLKEKMGLKVPEGQMLNIPDGNVPLLTYKAIDMGKSSLEFEENLSGFAVPSINKMDLAKKITNKSVSSATDIIKTEAKAEDVKIVTNPSWWLHRLPMFSASIEVKLETNEISGT